MLLRVNVGDIVRWDGEEYVVSAQRANQIRLASLRGGEPAWIDLITVAGEKDFEILGAPGGGRTSSERFLLMTMTPQEQKDVLWWRDHLLEVEFGVINPDDPSAVPRAGYDNRHVTVRRQLKAEELTAAGFPVTSKTLHRKWQAYQADGLSGRFVLPGHTPWVVLGPAVLHKV